MTKKLSGQRTTLTFESYILTFTKGSDEVRFENQVLTTQTDIIEYSNKAVEDSEVENKAEVKLETDKPTTGVETVGKLFTGIDSARLGTLFTVKKRCKRKK